MSVTSTSKESYQKLKDTLSMKQCLVFDKLQEVGPCSNRELAEYMHWSINTVTPRVYELRAKELIVEYGKGYDPKTRRKVTLWKAVNVSG